MKLFKRWFSKKPAISTKKVAFSYSEKQVLKDISLDLKQGEIVAIIGKSGSGKSTFLKILAGIISFGYSGKIKIFGSKKFFKQHTLGFIPQETAFIPDLSLEDNIKIIGLNYGTSEKKSLEKAAELMSLLKLEKDLKLFPSQLSGGEKVRFNIILSLLHDPKIIVLDEPFVGLDFKNRRILWHFIESMKSRKKAIVLTSHLLTEIQERVSRLIILKNGKIFFNGNLEKLKTKLKTNYILETKFSSLSNKKLQELKKFCNYKDIKILDSYNKYIMFAFQTDNKKETLLSKLKKLNLDFRELSYREPNLDEVFLGG